MSGINSVHALLALIAQQTQLVKQAGDAKIDSKQLELLFAESRLLHERIRNIEKLLESSQYLASQTKAASNRDVLSTEGNRPSAGLVTDLINRQERQQAFGSWESEAAAAKDTEPFTHRVNDMEEGEAKSELQQLLIQKYVPTDNDVAWAEISKSYGLYRNSPDDPRGSDYKHDNGQSADDRGRLMVVALGLAFLLLSLFAAAG